MKLTTKSTGHITGHIPGHIRSFSRRGNRLTPFQEVAINNYLSSYQLRQDTEKKFGLKELADLFWQ